MLGVAVVLAVLIGLLLGMLGGGGSVLMVPVLLYVLRLEPKAALMTSQLLLAWTSAVAMILHVRAGRVSWSTGILFGASGMLGAYLGGRAAHQVPAQLLLLGFTGLMLLSAVQMLRGRRPMASQAHASRSLRHTSVDFRVVAIMTAAMALGSILGGLLAQRLPAALLQRLFAGLLLGVALFMVLRSLW